MTELVRVGDIDVSQNLRYEKRAYRIRQVFSAVFALILIAGLLGVLGRSGPLSDTTTSFGDLRGQYQRFARFKTPTELRLKIGAGKGETNIAISNELLSHYQVQSYSIEPETTTALRDRVLYSFSQQPPLEVRFMLEPQQIGRHRGIVYGPGGNSISINQWVWP